MKQNKKSLFISLLLLSTLTHANEFSGFLKYMHAGAENQIFGLYYLS
jgi:hypothetical protein